MATIFLIFAVLGGTVLVCQFVLTLVGLGGDGDVPDDLPDDMPHDFSHGGFDAGHDVDAGGAGHDVHSGGHDAAHGHDSSWLFGIISFRTLVAAFAFFGLAGLAAEAAEFGLPLQLMIAVASGAAAMFGVHALMKMLSKLGEDSTIRIQRAIGQEGTVYVPIAAHRARPGKVQLKLQNRLMEFEAVTSSADKLATGTRVCVVAVRGNMLEVEPVAAGVAAKA